jgi:hypothetical protein
VARRGMPEVMEAAADDAGPLQRRLERRPNLTPASIVACGDPTGAMRR